MIVSLTWFFLTLGMACVALLLLFSVAQALLAANYVMAKRRAASGSAPAWTGPWPTVLVQLPVYNEFYVVDGLLNAVSRMDYPREKLTIQVLDDSTDATTAAVARIVDQMAQQGFSIHHLHRSNRQGFKAGALQAGLKCDTCEFVVIFDADFLPQPGFIKEVLKHFANPRVGLVQTRWAHINRNESVMTKLLAFGLDAHFSVEQGGRQSVGAFVNFNGTAGMWRRATIDDAGGWSSDCLTEDLDLSFRSQLKGWEFRYVEDVTTPSELPSAMSAIRSQQFRWTKGSAETARKTLHRLFATKTSFARKFFGMVHLLNSLVYPATLALSLCFVVLALFGGPQERHLLDALSFGLCASFAFMVFSYVIANRRGGLPDSPKRFLDVVLFSAGFVAVVTGLSFYNSRATLQGLSGRASAFVRTPKRNAATPASGPAYRAATNVLNLMAEGLLCLVFLAAAWNLLQYGLSPFIFTLLFFALSYLLILAFSLAEFLPRTSVAQ